MPHATQQVKPLGLSLRSVTSAPIDCTAGSDLTPLTCRLTASLAPVKVDPLCTWHPAECSQCQCFISLTVTAAHSQGGSLGTNPVQISHVSPQHPSEVGIMPYFTNGETEVREIRSPVQGCTSEVVGLEFRLMGPKHMSSTLAPSCCFR